MKDALNEPFEKIGEACGGGVPGEETSPLVGEEGEEWAEGRGGVGAWLRARGR